jgi:hypothetical protein
LLGRDRRFAARLPIVGTTRFGNIEFWNWSAGSAHQRGQHLPDVVEIGWTWLAHSAQRTGMNTEVKSGLAKRLSSRLPR